MGSQSAGGRPAATASCAAAERQSVQQHSSRSTGGCTSRSATAPHEHASVAAARPAAIVGWFVIYEQPRDAAMPRYGAVPVPDAGII